ncbi:hypothetical protein BV20DRAFT_861658 [Pilatotrama ljubarskyi]|nr:hypothetical protein BV20DRAFT_861658 [Pilatotrama ljubarskyi]
MALQPVLNYDVLLGVLEAASEQDVCRFMRTSRFFYTAGPKLLLRDTVRLDSENRLRQFLAFLHVQPHERFKLLHSLDLSFCDLSELASLELARALPLMSNLRSLTLHHGDYVLESHPSLVIAFAALTSLRELQMSYIHELSVTMLRNLRSRLVHAHLDFLGDDWGLFDDLPYEDWPRHHPAVLLSQSMTTLQAINSYRWWMHDEERPDPILVFPEMRRLQLEFTQLPLTMVLMNAYPNLTHLSYMTEDDVMGHRYAVERSEEYQDRHLLNVREQTNARRTWKGLQEFCGSLLDLYVLGLVCSIDDIRFSNIREYAPDMLKTMLCYARPRTLEFDGWPGELSLPAADVCGVLGGEAGSRLESLSFEAGLGKNEDHVDVAGVMEGLLSALQHSPLQQLKIAVMTTSVDPRPKEKISVWERLRRRGPPPPRPGVDEYPLNFAERSADDFNIEDYLRRFAQAIPSLRDAVVRVVGPRERWRMAMLKDGEVTSEEGVIRRL